MAIGLDETEVLTSVELRRIRTELILARSQLSVAQRDNKELQRKIAELEELACIDPLTGLWNRRGFERQFDAAFAQCRRNNDTKNAFLGLLHIDLDDFRTVNRTYLHPGGDAALCALAKLLKAKIRPLDFACRTGGDEFAVVLNNVRSSMPFAVSNRIAKAVQELSVQYEGNAFHISVSIGVISLKVDETTDKQHVIRQADQLLYQAKKSFFPKICRATMGNYR